MLTSPLILLRSVYVPQIGYTYEEWITEKRCISSLNCDIGDLRAYISCPLTTQKLSKKYHEARFSKQLSI